MTKPAKDGTMVHTDENTVWCRLDGLDVTLYRAPDGALVVTLDGPDDDDLAPDGSPDIRVWMNEALIYAHGEVGDDLSEGGTIGVAELRRTGGEGCL